MSAFRIEGKAIPGHPDTVGWGTPRWVEACGRTFESKSKAKKWIDRYGREGATYRVKTGAAAPCPRTPVAWGEWIAIGTLATLIWAANR